MTLKAHNILPNGLNLIYGRLLLLLRMSVHIKLGFLVNSLMINKFFSESQALPQTSSAYLHQIWRWANSFALNFFFFFSFFQWGVFWEKKFKIHREAFGMICYKILHPLVKMRLVANYFLIDPIFPLIHPDYTKSSLDNLADFGD